MVQISGKYKLVENKNFYEFLLATGASEDKAKEARETKGTLEITVDGNKIKLENDTPKYLANFVAGQEIDETLNGTLSKSYATISGDTITVTSKNSEGEPTLSRTFLFSDGGLELIYKRIKEGKEATSIYKRV